MKNICEVGLRRFPSFVAAMILALLLAGCAAKTPPAVPGMANAEEVWNAFSSQCADAGSGLKSFSLNASLSFAAQSASGRLNARFWGNFDGPMRLDFTTAVGSPYAMWREDASGWLGYYPGEGAFTHPDTKKGMAKLGMPLPFDLHELAAAATGRLCDFAPKDFERAKIAPEGYEYVFASGAPLKSLLLNFDGLPLRITGRGVDPWRVDFEDFQTSEGFSRPLPQKITLVTPGGTQARLRVKKLEARSAPWPAEALDLQTPVGASVLPLDFLEDVSVPQP